jgi:diguanylate cyclase (GGDEF)-like protein/PAS domain S-box-containing protein
MEIKMIATKSRTATSANAWLALSLFTALVITFALYIYSAKQVDRAHDMRHKSFLVADELRQASDDLTRMARSFIATGNPIYKQSYQAIIAIAEGKLPRPKDYTNSYWELALVGKQPQATEAPMSMLELFLANGFTLQELDVLKASKISADALTNTELAAMALVEQAGPELETNRRQALSMVFGDDYNHAKVSIMQPINQFYQLQDKRTLQAVRHAERKAAIILVVLIGFGLSLIFMLWRINQAVRITLGGTVNEIYQHIKLIGTGDFSATIKLSAGQENSVLAWLAETQRSLQQLRQERLQVESAKQESDARYRKLFDSAGYGIVIFLSDPNQKLLDGNPFLCEMFGYSLDELRELRPADVVAAEQITQIAPAIDSIESADLAREWRLKRKDGSVFTADVISTSMPDGTMMSMIRDITARKQAEEELRNSEENLAITLQSIGDAVIATDTHGKITRMNPVAEQLTGWPLTEAIGQPLNKVFHIINADTREPARNPAELVMEHGNVVGLANHTALIARDGKEYQISDSAAPIRDNAGKIRGVVLVFSDVTEKYLAVEALHKADERFRRTFKLIPNPLTLQTPEGVLLDCSDAFCESTGYSRDELIGHNIKDFNLWVDPDKRLAMREALIRDKKIDNFEFELRRRNSEIRAIEFSARFLTAEPEPILLAVAYDITARKQAELALQESVLHTQAILDNMFDGVITINTKGVIESYNKAARHIFGYPQDEVLGGNITKLMPSHYKTQHENHLKAHEGNLNGQELNILREVEGQRKDGEIFPMSLSITKILRSGKTTFVGVIRDISQQRRDEEEIYRLAFYDPLTNLPNRRLLYDRLQQAIHTSCRTDQHGALMFLDLDHFKQLNDSLGHDLGDILLQQVASRLQACVREGDSVARMGGDEFVMLIEALSIYPNEAAAQAETIAHKILASLAQPYLLREHTYVITPSIGIVVFLHHEETFDELLKKADVAMYQAKTAGRNNARFFDPTMQAAVSVRVALEKSMRLALERNEFLLNYQFQVDSQGTPTGVEALVRWLHPEHGMISPASFIPLAEETGMILTLGQWVLETACEQLVEWATIPATSTWTMAVNVSVSQFAQPNFVANVTKALEKTGANPRLLKLELTESMLAKDVEDVIVKMFEIKTLGVTFSLDDFGTGYSSLSYLKRLPLDQLKIDQSFVRDLFTDANDATIARTIIALGHSLSLRVIAEGVETLEQRNALAEMGCDAYQGYYFARPVAASDLAQTMSKIPHLEI